MKRKSSLFNLALSFATLVPIAVAPNTLHAQQASSATTLATGSQAVSARPPRVRFLIPQAVPYHGDTLCASELRCEGLPSPIGLDVLQPRLSWKLESPSPAKNQSAYRILVASNLGTLASDIADIWDSKKMESTDSSSLLTGGRQLVPNEECFWKVKVWDNEGRESPWSAPARWTVGKLSAEASDAEWIGFDAPRQRAVEPAPMGNAHWITQSADNAPQDPKAPAVLLAELEIPERAPITSAYLYSAAEGRSRIFINARPVSTSYLASFDKLVSVANVMQNLNAGKNFIRVEITPLVGDPQSKRFIARLAITLSDGTVLERVTDDTWRTVSAPGTDWSSRPMELPPLPRVQIPSTAPENSALKMASVFLPPASYLRKTFAIPKPVHRAQLYTSTLGAADFYINGKRLQQNTIPLLWTNFQKQVYNRVFDVTDALQRGDNAIAAVLTDGWFSGYVSPMQSRDQFGTAPRLRAELQIEFVDGAKMLVLSDAEWKAATGALQQADPTLGERYDARAELLKWNTPDFDASLWAPVITGAKETAPPSKDSLQADPIPFAELPSRSTKQAGEKTWIFDLGQPLKGTYQLSVQEAAGTVVRLRFAKSLNAAGGVESPLQRTDFTEDTYICNGAEKESFSPRFSIRHYRFVEISGLSKQPTEETFFGIALTNVPVGEDLTEEAKILP